MAANLNVRAIFPLIKTPRLILRAWRPEDREDFFQLNADPEVMKYFPRTLSRAESDAFISADEKHWQEQGFGKWAIETQDSKEFIGYVGLTRADFPCFLSPRVEIGWRLGKKFWGRGYASEAARASLSWGFIENHLPEIVSFTVPANIKSLAVMQRQGMIRDLQGDFDHPKMPTGHALCRHVLYRLSRRQFDTLQGS